MKVAKLAVDGRVLISRLWVAEGMFDRMRGLLGRSGLPEDDAMLLRPCGSIHTVGMQFSIDVIFLDQNQCVTRVVKALKPCRFALGGRGAHSAIEMEAGRLDLSVFSVGAPLEVLL